MQPRLSLNSLCSSVWPQTHYAAQVDLELTMQPSYFWLIASLLLSLTSSPLLSICFVVLCWGSLSLCSSGWPKALDPPDTVSMVLGLQVSATMAGSFQPLLPRTAHSILFLVAIISSLCATQRGHRVPFQWRPGGSFLFMSSAEAATS